MQTGFHTPKVGFEKPQKFVNFWVFPHPPFVKVLYNAVTSEAPSLNDLELEYQLDIAVRCMDNFRELLRDFTDYCELKILEGNKKV